MRRILVGHTEPDPDALAPAVRALRAGELVAFPTETVYGLGADALQPNAVDKIFAAKQRPPDNPLIVHIGDRSQLAELAADVPRLAAELSERLWPGPLTLVLNASASVPAVTTGSQPTVAVRMPAHPIAQELLRRAGRCVAAPSANRAGRPSPTAAEHVAAELADELAVLVDGGPCPIGVESTVADVRGDQPLVLREGAVTREQLGADQLAASPGDQHAAASPGTRYRHYAPGCSVEIAPQGHGASQASQRAATGARVGVVGPQAPSDAHDVCQLAAPADAAELSRCLYDALFSAETAGLDVVVVEAVDELGIGRAVMERLRRAAAA
jgi:L-threonylcarbamoyladenylate synthase